MAERFFNTTGPVVAEDHYRIPPLGRLDLDEIPEAAMGTVRKTITLTNLHDRWIKAQIAAGHFTNDSEYIRDLIRRDRERSSEYEALKAAVQEGLDSGPSEKTVPSIMEEVEARLRSDGRL